MRFLRLIEKIPRFVRQEGFGAAVRLACNTLIGFVYRSTSAYLLTREIRMSPEMPFLPSKVEIGFLKREDIGQLASIVYYDSDEISRRLAQNQKCLVGRVDGKIVHYSWLSRKNSYARELEQEVEVHPQELYLYNCRTLRANRGQGIFRAAIGKLLAEADSEGVTRLRALVEARNRSSLSVFQKMGFRTEKEICFRRILWHRSYKIQCNSKP